MHKYSLRNNPKMLCPKCNNKTFNLYCDNITKEPLNEIVGRCDREDNCSYHYPPKQYFKDHPENKLSFKQNLKPVVSNNISYNSKNCNTSISFLNKSDVEYFQKKDDNNLFKYLIKIFNKENVIDTFKKYRVDTYVYNKTVFWQIDINGHYRTGKIMDYNLKGHREKDNNYSITWAHSLLSKKYHKPFVYEQCFFGEHLLIEHDKTVCIVESEKTAIIASIVMPECIWIATGGKRNFQLEKCQVLKGFDVILFPDLKATEEWMKFYNNLLPICKTVRIYKDLENTATEEQRRAGLDIADFLIEEAISKKKQ